MSKRFGEHGRGGVNVEQRNVADDTHSESSQDSHSEESVHHSHHLTNFESTRTGYAVIDEQLAVQGATSNVVNTVTFPDGPATIKFIEFDRAVSITTAVIYVYEWLNRRTNSGRSGRSVRSATSGTYARDRSFTESLQMTNAPTDALIFPRMTLHDGALNLNTVEDKVISYAVATSTHDLVENYQTALQKNAKLVTDLDSERSMNQKLQQKIRQLSARRDDSLSSNESARKATRPYGPSRTVTATLHGYTD